MPPSRVERTLARVVVALSVAVLLAAAPFATVPLTPVAPFIPIYQAALAISDIITAVLLFGQVTILRSRGILALACGYLFTALMIVPHTLSFPGLFAPTGLLGAGPQTTAWLYMGWHAGFPLLVIAYALLAGSRRDRLAGSAGAAIAAGVAAVAAAVVAWAALATAGQAWLPAIMNADRYTPSMIFVIGAIWALSGVALAVVWRRRPRTVLDLWLIVVLCAWICDIALSVVLNAGRFDLGFYVGRVFGLMAASFVLLVLLLETRGLYVRLARSLEYEREAAVVRAADLTVLNELLEARVAERSKALEAEIAERERAQVVAREAQKLEAIGRLAGGVAHDFNNLLTVIQAHAEFIGEAATREQERESAMAIDHAVERGARLIRQLMVFSRRQALKPEVVDLRARAGEMGDLLGRSLRGDIRMVVELADDLWPVECDPGELELALMNLCVNARDAMPRGGLVRLIGRNLDGVRDNGVALDGPHVALIVADTGTGIAPENLARVFEPFFTTKDVGKGTGLGLSQVYGFAQQAGGGTTIDSALGEGTAVTIYLPRARAAAAAGAADGPGARLRASGTVLLVEDDDAVALVASRMLALLGYQAHHVRDARTALSVLLGGAHFVLLFSDIVMPGGMTGIELARKVRQHFPRLPILLATGATHAAADVVREGFTLIAKPYRADALSDAIRQTLAEAGEGARETG
jgi:signal transduction histidine kinase/CheY-like chemotaxis protein